MNQFEVKSMKINAPQITEIREAGAMLNQITTLQEQELAAENVLFISEVLIDEDLSGIDYTIVVFENCKLLNCNFTKAGFTNVRFKECDISNCNFENGYFNQVEFVSCKGVGCKFSNSTIKHVRFVDSNFTYSNFEQSKFQKVIITSSNFGNACIAEGILKDLVLEDVTLENCDFFKTPLKGIDFRESRIDGILLSDTHNELVGAIVDTYQAASLARFLGIEVK